MIIRLLAIGSCLIALLAGEGIACGQNPLAPVAPYDGIQAGLDAYRLGEERRQGAVNQQLFTNDQLRFWNGYPTSRGETIYYGYMSPAALANYGYGGYGPWTGFQPGPWMGGGLLGSPYYYPPARQPIGQQQIQTSPNRWESHPVYDPPLTSYRAMPPVDSPLLDRTPYASAPTITAAPTVPPAAAPPASLNSVPPAPPGSPTSSLLKAIDAIPPPAPADGATPLAPGPAAPRGPREY